MCTKNSLDVSVERRFSTTENNILVFQTGKRHQKMYPTLRNLWPRNLPTEQKVFFFLNKDLKEIQGFEEKSVFNTFKKP